MAVGWRGWVAGAVGPGARVVRSRPLHGGVTSAVHAVDVEDRSGRRHRLVLRRWRPDGPVDDAPSMVRAEVRVLEALEAGDFAGAPRCVAADPDGATAGWPAVLSTRLAGRPVVASDDPRGWAGRLAAAVVDACVRLRRVPSRDLPPYAPWYPVGRPAAVEPPPYVLDGARWTEAMTAVADRLPPSAHPPQVVHRDLNPGNVLWVRGRPVGIVDWVNASVGPVEQDLGRCRVNLWLLGGREVADAFSAEVDRLGFAYDTAWDLAGAAEMAPWLDDFTVANRLGARLTQDLVHRRMEELVVTTGR